jgi:hypothetical protein
MNTVAAQGHGRAQAEAAGVYDVLWRRLSDTGHRPTLSPLDSL